MNAANLKAQKEQGVQRKLVGIKMEERGIPRSHYDIQDEGGNRIGEITSGTQSPTLGVGIGLGYVKTEFAAPGTPVYINVRNKPLKAKVVKLPFVSKGA